MAMEHTSAEETEAILLDEEAATASHPVRRSTRRAALLVSLLTGALALALFSWSRRGHSSPSGRPMFMELAELIEKQSSVCDHLPFLRIERIVSSNLGGQGPDNDKPEGLVYAAKAYNTGMGNVTDVQVHLNVVSGSEFTHSEAEGTELPASYEPAWPAENGVHGHFAVVNLKAGSNVTLRVHGYNPAMNENIGLPKAALTFFDLDSGNNANRSVEYVKMQHYKAYFLTNATEIQVSQDEDGTTFTASEEGSGDDNPDDPLELTVLQQNRAVSFEFEDEEAVVFQLGASPGETARVFSFVLRPALRCASTLLDDGSVLPRNASDAPVTVVRGAGRHAQPLLLLSLVAALMSLPLHRKE